MTLGVRSLAAILLFCGPIGKSAQFPLHVWLPDAMEGPTPVSALIHAATMVTAGVFFVGRANGLFILAPPAFGPGAAHRAATAILAASLPPLQERIKRGVAYSTPRQVGYMFPVSSVW